MQHVAECKNRNVPHASAQVEVEPSQLTVECSQVRHGRQLLFLLAPYILHWVHLGKVEASVLCAFTRAQFIYTFVFLAHTHTNEYLSFSDQLWQAVYFLAITTVNYLIKKICTNILWGEVSSLRKYMLTTSYSIFLLLYLFLFYILLILKFHRKNHIQIQLILLVIPITIYPLKTIS